MGNNVFEAVFIDNSKCIGCVNCMKRCPTKAIRIVKGKAVVDHSRCIGCGECVRVCQKKAVYPNFDYFDIIKLKTFKYKIALVSPAYFGQFNTAKSADYLLSALLKIGFDGVYETARASKMLSLLTLDEMRQGKLPKPCISTSCPVCVELILMCFHDLKKNLAPYIPAAHVAAKKARKEAVKKTGLKPDEIGVFFLSPCPAHANAIRQELYKSDCGIDGVLSLKEVSLKVMNVKITDEDKKISCVAGAADMLTAVVGGEVKNIGSNRALAVDGIENVISALKELEDGKLPGVEFIELNACPGGCVSGVMNIENGYFAKSTMIRLKKEDLKNKTNVTDSVDEPAEYYKRPDEWQVNNAYYQLDKDFKQAFEKMRVLEQVKAHLPGFDCGMCGAPSCKDFAEDVAKGKADIKRCIKYRIDKDKE